MNTSIRRPGFTLVELLIVLGIIVLAVGILVPVTLSLSDRNQVPKGASMVENAFQVAKSRALATKRPNGVRLIATDLNKRAVLSSGAAFAWYNQLQYIEDPGDYTENWVWGLSSVGANAQVTQPWWGIPPSGNPLSRAQPIPGEQPKGYDSVIVGPGPFTFDAITEPGGRIETVTKPRSVCLFGPISSLGANTWTGVSGTTYQSQRYVYTFIDNLFPPSATVTNLEGVIMPGDRIELLGTGELFTVMAVSATLVTGPPDRITGQNVNISGNANAIFVPVMVLDRSLPRDVHPPLNGRSNYRVIRQPRVVPSLQTVKLPQDVVIDLTPTRTFAAGAPGNPAMDLDVNGTYPMSGVSQGIGISNITGLTVPPGPAPQLIAPLYVDILFSPSGEVLTTSRNFGSSTGTIFGFSSAGEADLIALWVHQVASPDLWADRQPTASQGNVDNQALVSIHARTGTIGSYPVARIGAVPNPYDPLYNVRLGKARISADTGP